MLGWRSILFSFFRNITTGMWMPLFLVCFFCPAYGLDMNSQNITYQMFISKSIHTCVENPNTDTSSDVVKSIFEIGSCIQDRWNQCLEMTEERTNRVLKKSDWFPCNKGIMVTTNKEYTLTVHARNSFHFNVTFLRFQLASSNVQCDIHYLKVILICH